ncbi:hypothetical protein GALL_304070 [mine drainage metagenome]|uniref:Uncharacterized protein n=1 Tax=mine drainage metagenome TaxID=410659 RepID=A0A1J5QVN1_9ZZZZ
MSALKSELENNVSQLFRTAAKQYGDVVTQFGGALVAYGKRETDARTVVQTTLKLAVGEAGRMIETEIGLVTAYVNWVASLVGIKDLAQQAPGLSEPKPGTGKPSRK